MASPALQRASYADYLATERETGLRHEFLDGEVRLMSGGTLRHSALKTNLGALLRDGLRGGPCRPYDADARLRVPATGLATYADFAIVCGPPVPHAEDPLAYTNPTALFEVLSPTTEAWDRGGKFLHAQQLPSLRWYVLVSQDAPRVEVYTRRDDGWTYAVHVDGAVRWADLGLALHLSELYADLPP
ncbi:MAG: Uma2 family endonuclease [Myxococcota bacterium]